MRQHRRAWLKRLFKDDEATGRAVLKATAGPKRKSKDKKEQRVAQRSFDDGAGEAEREEGEVAVVKERYHGVRNAYPRHIRLILLDWLKKHRHHPFITTSDEYRQLREATSLNNSQIKVCNVFCTSCWLDSFFFASVKRAFTQGIILRTAMSHFQPMIYYYCIAFEPNWVQTFFVVEPEMSFGRTTIHSSN